MSKFTKTLLIFLIIVSLIGSWLYWFVATRESREPSRVAFMKYCANCHGVQLEGTDHGPSLLTTDVEFGGNIDELAAFIQSDTHKEQRSKWEKVFEPEMFTALALFISEQRQRFPGMQASYREPHKAATEGAIESDLYALQIEKVTTLSGRPYAIAPLPSGQILVSEKVRGLSLVSQTGTQSDLVEGTPPVWEELVNVQGTIVTLGSLLDVALHPDYKNNGWIYLSHAHRCDSDCGVPWPITMTRVVRGRIEDSQWVDQEIIWSVHPDYYTVVPDGVAGGRLAFDKDNNLYITVGGKSPYKNLHNLNTPYGKVHRVKDDGTAPEDNPFWVPKSEREIPSTIHTVWSYGHRTAQGLDGHPATGELWSTEMGPRGGDEINKLIAGGNFGWPLYTNGLDYDAGPLTIGVDLGLDYAIEDTVLPIVDFTPAPAISNFTFYEGEPFGDWRNDLLVGSLKAQTLYRVRVKDDRLIDIEKLVTGIGRIRDVAIGYDGLVYIATEHDNGGSLIRLSPAE